MSVQIRGLTRRYGREAALAGIDLEVGDGELLALLGPSGAGKTTLLRVIAGLDRPDAGTVLIDGRDVRRLSPRERQIGFVFQSYALFRHMNVARNIGFGLSVKPRRERPSRQAIARRVEELLELMQLSGLGRRFPAQLSGGQRQRAALARALAIDPKLLLLDEPFGALDAKVRAELRVWLRDLQHRLRLTTIFVTHDQHEAFQLADRVAILNGGRVERIGTPREIRAHPATPFLAEFLGAADHAIANDRAGPAIKPCDPADPPPECGSLGVAPVAAYSDNLPMDQTVFDYAPPRPSDAAVPAAADRPREPLSATDRPVVSAGELWVVELAAEGLSRFEQDALVSANVIIYDRTLASTVSAALALGGYAEPASDNSAERCLGFVRDGWSVVRVVDRGVADFLAQLRMLALRLSAAGAPEDLPVSALACRGGADPKRIETRLADLDTLPEELKQVGGRAVGFAAFGGSKAALPHAVAFNGLAG
ncbi:MAG TPA: ATP-binding cassette domain-containing protein [Stellaceae bacterium]|nr:ATP-binding cassette domain-containing protein [Stellaceae bacterium]